MVAPYPVVKVREVELAVRSVREALSLPHAAQHAECSLGLWFPHDRYLMSKSSACLPDSTAATNHAGRLP